MTEKYEWLRSKWANARHGLNKFFGFLGVLIGALGACATLISMISSSSNTQQLIQTLSLSVIALISLAALAWREISLGRKAKLASTIDRQQAASEKIRDLYSFLTKNIHNYSDDENKERILKLAKSEIKSILDEYSSIVSQLISQRCRICIKVICSEGGDPYVYTLARDCLSSRECCKNDIERERTKFDKLKINNFLVKMFDDKQTNQNFFFSNDLTGENYYNSSSIKFNTDSAGESCSANRRKWCLPYKSAIVVPIKQDAREDLDIDEGEEMLVGFVGIDSPSRWAFSRRWDIPLAQSLANSLFPILRRYAEVDAHP